MSVEFEEDDFALDTGELYDDDGPIIEPEPVSEPVIADFHDERNRLDYYWPRVEQLDVPTPDTTMFELTRKEDGGMPEWDTEGILEWMRERDTQQAFVRSAYKSALSREGQYIHNDDPATVDRTIAEMLSSHVMQQMPHGGIVVVREWLDLNFSFYARGDCHPEIRFFIDEGEVKAATPRLEPGDFLSEEAFESAQDITEQGIRRVKHYARTVAEEFTDNPWSVDFVMDTNGDWYCTEMGLDGVYYSSDKEQWRNICGHADVEDVSPAVEYADELPEDPDESLKSELR